MHRCASLHTPQLDYLTISHDIGWNTTHTFPGLPRRLRRPRFQNSHNLTAPSWVSGDFLVTNSTVNASMPYTFVFDRILDQDKSYPEYNYLGKGCYRDPTWPWYLQSAPPETLFLLVPLFASLLALWNQYYWRQRKIDFTATIAFACISYAGAFVSPSLRV